VRVFLRTCWSVLWSAVWYPTWHTCIDYGTGEVLFHYRDDRQTGRREYIDRRNPPGVKS
jgi:hypothetical protein